jgi:hypothetical protein
VRATHGPRVQPHRGDPESVLHAALDWLRDTYREHRFFKERDLEAALQQLTEFFEESGPISAPLRTEARRSAKPIPSATLGHLVSAALSTGSVEKARIRATTPENGLSDSQNSQNEAIVKRSQSGGRTLQNRCKAADQDRRTACLENRYTSSRRVEGSNPSPSAE